MTGLFLIFGFLVIAVWGNTVGASPAPHRIHVEPKQRFGVGGLLHDPFFACWRVDVLWAKRDWV